jgi:hypothetical protein
MTDLVEDAIYVAPDGEDIASGNELHPVYTLDRASALTRPGGTIYYTDGVHHHLTKQMISRNGNEGERITVCPMPGAKATIDGRGNPNGTDTLVMIDGSYVTFRDIECCNSSRQGIAIYAAKYVEVLGCDVHDCWETGIINEGPTVDSNIGTLIEGNTVHRNTNHNLTGEPGYGQGISLSKGKGAMARRNYIFNNKGEGLGIMKGHVGGSAIENVSFDNYKINIYIDSPVDGAWIKKNLCYCTGNEKYLTYGERLKSTGITFARETGSGHIEGIVCEDNSLLGCHYGISFFIQKRDSGLVGANFNRNLIANSVAAAMWIEKGGASGNELHNNIFASNTGAPHFEGDMEGYEIADDNFFYPELAAA